MCARALTLLHMLPLAAEQILAKTPVPVRMETLHHAAIYEHRMQAGSKPIFHLEAFLARFMSCYKKYMVANFGK